MARNIGEQCKRCRRAGEKLFLKGSKCDTPKCPFTRRSYAPGIQGSMRRKRPSEYGTQLLEKQKAKATYGVLERQFVNYVKEARKEQNTGYVLMRNLEMRLDNIVYKANKANSRAQARQAVSHKLVKVNNRVVNIPSYRCSEGDKIEILKPLGVETERDLPKWLSTKGKHVLVGKITAREDLDTNLNEQLIIEYYSR